MNLARDLENSGKKRLGFKLSLDLIYGLSFRIQAASNYKQSWVQKTGFISYLVDFNGRNWLIPGFYENKTQHWALFSTKTNQGWAEDPAAANHVTQAVCKLGWRLGLKVGFKELQLMSKFLNRGLCDTETRFF